MVQIVFRNTEQKPPARKVVRAVAARIVGPSLLAVFEDKEVLLATGRGRRWQMGYRFFTSVEIQSVRLKLVEVEDEEREAA